MKVKYKNYYLTLPLCTAVMILVILSIRICFILLRVNLSKYICLKRIIFRRITLEAKRFGFFPYSIGTPILKEYNNSYFKPTLTFGSLVKDKCNNKITIDRNKAELITFKKSIIINNLFSFNNAIVLDDRKDFVAFAILKPIKLNKIENATEVIPTLDIGWYLREGG
ncbi:hypothetical protein [Sulfuracidifex metallicus]|uniref:hypothetical protein n=1 Tax=Sulfuracidifex metallicus TaxID=47303 RepID=UPI0006D0AE2F|nr:hypothetical protein [Sulfuracidifex metallicus]